MKYLVNLCLHVTVLKADYSLQGLPVYHILILR